MNTYGIKVVVLDFDGVITNLSIDWKYVRSVASSTTGFEVRSLLDFWREYFGTELFFRVSKLVENFEFRAVQVAKPIHEVVKLIKYVAGRGVKVYIATMQSKASVNFFLEKYGLLSYVAGILTREDMSSKDEMLRHVLKIEGVKPEEVLFIDDSERNIKLCRELGAICIHVKSDIGSITNNLRELLY